MQLQDLTPVFGDDQKAENGQSTRYGMYMKIAAFRCLFSSLVADPLRAHGFEAEGDSLFCVRDDSTLAVLRESTKYSNVAQEADYIIAIRHNFLPDMEGVPFRGYVNGAANYPFRFHPLSMQRNFRIPWLRLGPFLDYRSGWVHESDCLRICFGEEDPEPKLALLRQNTVKFGLALLRHVTPRVGAAQIATNGEGWYIENVWLQAYREAGFLDDHQEGSGSRERSESGLES